jgi:hypothetical protein
VRCPARNLAVLQPLLVPHSPSQRFFFRLIRKFGQIINSDKSHNFAAESTLGRCDTGGEVVVF